MTAKSYKNLKHFKKGQSGNPGGRPKETPQERIVKDLTRDSWTDLSKKMMTCTKEELEDLLAGGLPYESELFIRQMLSLGEKPDWHAYERYLSRRIGPLMKEFHVKVDQEDKLEHNKKLEEMYEELRTMLSDQPKDIECHGQRLDGPSADSSLPSVCSTGLLNPKLDK